MTSRSFIHSPNVFPTVCSTLIKQMSFTETLLVYFSAHQPQGEECTRPGDWDVGGVAESLHSPCCCYQSLPAPAKLQLALLQQHGRIHGSYNPTAVAYCGDVFGLE